MKNKISVAHLSSDDNTFMIIKKIITKRIYKDQVMLTPKTINLTPLTCVSHVPKK
jgi:hypothetical protein